MLVIIIMILYLKKREEEKKRSYHDILLRICSLYVFIHCSSGGKRIRGTAT